MPRKTLLYGNIDPRGFPNYGLAEAAHILSVPAVTVRTWVAGRFDGIGHGPIIDVASREPVMLSFTNLVEAHVIGSLRALGLSLQKVRQIVRYITDTIPVRNPLAHADIWATDRRAFVEAFGQYLDATQGGQLGIPEVVWAYYRRIDRDEAGLAQRLYPYLTEVTAAESPRLIEVNPRVSFGRPVLAGTGVPSEVIAERVAAGEAQETVAADYGRSVEEIEQVIAWETRRAA